MNKLSGKPPAEYIRKYNITAEALASHLIPDYLAEAAKNGELLEELWGVEQYENFVNERSRLLAEGAKSFLQRLAK